MHASPSARQYPAAFLDRDGVVVENRANYIRSWDDVEILPGAIDALVGLSATEYRIIFVTNQSAVGRGIIALEVAEAINRRLVGIIKEAGGRVDRVYMCPHAPVSGCDCRKPQPGMFYLAAQELDLDMERSLVIGDALTDLQAARAAGLSQLALVLTGRGREQAEMIEASDLSPVAIYDDLASALADMVK